MKLLALTWICIIFCLVHPQTDSSLPDKTNPDAHPSPEITTDSISPSTPNQSLNETFLQNIEEKDIEQRTEGVLNEWVRAELNRTSTLRDFSALQSFIIHLQPLQQYEFKWDLYVPSSKKRIFQLLFNVYTYEVGDDISLIRNPEQDNFISVQLRETMREPYVALGKFYVTKTFELHFQEDTWIIRVKNMNGRPVLLEVNMEVEQPVAGSTREAIATNEHFQLPAQKLQTISEQSKATDRARSRMYKWEWGFLEREERYEDQMLKLTGVELFAIIVTAIVQMYCIKGLLDNKQII